MTEEHRAANRERQRAVWQRYTPEQWAARTASLRPKRARYFNTSIEIAMRVELNRRGIEHIQQHRCGRFQVDFCVPSAQLVIECDGDYWHSRPEQIVKDAAEDEWLRAHGFVVARITETAIRRDVSSALDEALDYAASLGKPIRFLEPPALTPEAGDGARP